MLCYFSFALTPGLRSVSWHSKCSVDCDIKNCSGFQCSVWHLQILFVFSMPAFYCIFVLKRLKQAPATVTSDGFSWNWAKTSQMIIGVSMLAWRIRRGSTPEKPGIFQTIFLASDPIKVEIQQNPRKSTTDSVKFWSCAGRTLLLGRSTMHPQNNALNSIAVTCKKIAHFGIHLHKHAHLK